MCKSLLISVILIFVLIAGNIFAAQDFSADLTIAEGKDTTAGTITVNKDFYRLDLMEEGMPIYVIVDRNNNVTRAYNVEAKQYLEMKSQDMSSLMNDPFQGVIYTAKVAGEENLGTEKIAGYECDKLKYAQDGQDLMMVWKAKDLDFPVKIDNLNQSDYSVTLSNIKVGDIDQSLFKHPEGFSEMGGKAPAPDKSPDLDIIDAAGMGNLDAIKQRLAEGVDVNYDDGKGYTPLLMAAMYGRTKAVIYLIEAGADVNLVTSTGLSPILAASQYGKDDIVKTLVEAGADINMVYGNGNTTILREAIKYGHVELVKYLIEAGADTGFKNAQGESLMKAANKNDAEMMEILKSAGIE